MGNSLMCLGWYYVESLAYCLKLDGKGTTGSNPTHTRGMVVQPNVEIKEG